MSNKKKVQEDTVEGMNYKTPAAKKAETKSTREAKNSDEEKPLSAEKKTPQKQPLAANKPPKRILERKCFQRRRQGRQ